MREFLSGVPRDAAGGRRRGASPSAGRASLLRPDALAAWRRWRGEGARLVIVTASPELVVAPFARGLGADAADRHPPGLRRATTASPARFDGPNCRGPEKVGRLRAAFGDGRALAAAYGDTSGDREMLAIADEPATGCSRAP